MNKKRMIVTTLVTLLPILLGLALYARLPESIAVHFDAAGNPDNWTSKAGAVFGLPLFLAAINLILQTAIAHDPKREKISNKMFAIAAWTIPAISVVMNGACLLMAVGYNISIFTLCTVFLGVMFLLVGNYLPKCRQNYTTGIKLPWTLSSEDNWNYTHRIAGFTWTLAGICFLINAVVFIEWLFFATLVLMLVIPVGASFLYYVKNEKK